jgi:hypothetical protein
MAWIGVANLPFSAAYPQAFGSTGIYHFETSRFVWATPIRSNSQHSAPRLVQSTEEQNESESKASPIFRHYVHSRSVGKPLFATQSLSIISPDHLIELPGTPPPVLRI